MKTLSGKEACKILEKHGFILVRQRGSHIIMQKKIDNSTVTVPVPDHKELRTGTLQLLDNQVFQKRNLSNKPNMVNNYRFYEKQ
jgi:predicted RNA binding protein YcfA (HicA-like mRNA interferase family)